MRLHAKLYIAAIIAGGSVCLAYGALGWTCRDPVSYGFLLCLALVTSMFQVKIPGAPSSLSVGFVFVVLGVIDFSYPETLFMAVLAIAVQCKWLKVRQTPLQFLFNLFSVAIAASIGCATHAVVVGRMPGAPAAALAATAYFLTNSLSISVVMALTGSVGVRQSWRDCFRWLFPYYLLGAAIATAISWGNRRFGWQTSVLALPAVYVLFRSYSLYLERLEREKSHAEQMSALHLRTIEALAMAIEAKDVTTHDHLQRVQIYAVELGKVLGVAEDDLRALRAASILHDIGKLAVPEHILSKPGKLTAEEFETMKIHPVVGAEILERVEFPYNVVPIVRSHHERWNGTGYPDGLKGEEIPFCARILAAVDCLDALASDRQYRRALPLDEAMAVVVSESGKSYDPVVVGALRQHYLEWEQLTRTRQSRGKLSRGGTAAGGTAPAAGLQAAGSEDAVQRSFLSLIAAARQEAQALYELSQELGSTLNLHETLALLDSRLQPLIPYDAIAVYVREGDQLSAKYVSGENMRLFSKLRIPLGQGLSGWVAETGKPIVNGNPSVEPGYLNDPAKFSRLRSALAVPLENAAGITGVLTLYHLDRDAFTKDHLRVLQALKAKVSLTIENALQYQTAKVSAGTDALITPPGPAAAASCSAARPGPRSAPCS